MPVLCRILIAATLVVHLMVGCCVHHAHECEGDLSLAHNDAADHGEACEHADDHSHHGADDCQGAKCSFLATNRTTGNHWWTQPQPACLVAVIDFAIAPAGVAQEYCPLASGRLLLPVRLHLANQVLLI